ncbi:biotin-dependent carboxyltransferase family protein [Luteimonas kalidii]|uniref:Biotin-dependent carboxyltransferase family protein n=1 Tax=Luteimonas kalidii TaxID=3042025 RepID=A0ABT6JTM8_9GAMM|nr:biotin-dependent carboxyltransferase family protein [Luteimonas kalidii]MDH5834049.1 biotin-dependent carboxyltransferase family protein [Luteimonas kalidii]
MSIEVLSPGLATLLQDGGRQGLRHLGVGGAGALDPWAFALANLVVGNPAGTAALEITLSGPTLRFHRAARIALCGAPVDAEVGGAPVPGHRPLDLPPGSTLRIGRCTEGARAYLAIAGGVRSEAILGSASTDLRGGFGGHAGRALCRGDRLALAAPSAGAATLHIAPWWIDPAFDDRPAGAEPLVRVLPGSDATAPPAALHGRAWTVRADSNRQGLRLAGPVLTAADGGERVSEPVMPGTIQLPADGQPIVLLADAQTHGGYPRIGHAIRADWPLLAQLRPGDRVRFAPCTPGEARDALCRQRQRLHRIALALDAKRALA